MGSKGLRAHRTGQPTTRNYVARAAWERNGAGPHGVTSRSVDRRKYAIVVQGATNSVDAAVEAWEAGVL